MLYFIYDNMYYIFSLVDHDSILSHLEKVQGSVETKHEFTQMIIDEATRFKNRELVERLTELSVKYEQSAVQNSRNHVTKNVNR